MSYADLVLDAIATVKKCCATPKKNGSSQDFSLYFSTPIKNP